MKKLIVSAALMGMASVALAEVQFDVMYDALPMDHGMPTATATVADFAQINVQTIDCAVNGPAGVPLAYQCVIQADDLFPTTAQILNLSFSFDCGGDMVTYSLDYAPFSNFYLTGPPSPPAPGGTDFGIDAQADCSDVVPTDTEDLPTAFALGNAYPNPFNPATTIEFALPQVEMVSLNVFNITGQKVATLVNETMARGSYEITFDASALSSGVYMYTLEAGDYSDTKKMVLVK